MFVVTYKYKNYTTLVIFEISGITYFIKYSSAFSNINPITHFNTFDDEEGTSSAINHHYKWLCKTSGTESSSK